MLVTVTDIQEDKKFDFAEIGPSIRGIGPSPCHSSEGAKVEKKTRNEFVSAYIEREKRKAAII